MKKYIVLLFTVFSPLAADVTDYLKPIKDKNGEHKIKNVDFIYLINLDERPEKFDSCKNQLAPFGIEPYRFSAVNGWKLTLEEINNLGVHFETWMMGNHLGTCYPIDIGKQPLHEIVSTPGRTYFCHCMSRGSIGIVLSHMSILQDALDSGYETIWVLEDDIEIIKNPHLISERIEELDALVGKDGWDILFTDFDTKGQNGQYVPCSSYAWRPNFIPVNPQRFAEQKIVGEQFRQIGARYGAYSMILKRSGIKKILNFLKCYQIFLPYDMEYTLPTGIRIFTVLEDIVSTQPKALSDNAAPNFNLSLLDEK
jgi:GR25 family glycosyltransferase involved in LPS biosynthesis